MHCKSGHKKEHRHGAWHYTVAAIRAAAPSRPCHPSTRKNSEFAKPNLESRPRIFGESSAGCTRGAITGRLLDCRRLPARKIVPLDAPTKSAEQHEAARHDRLLRKQTPTRQLVAEHLKSRRSFSREIPTEKRRTLQKLQKSMTITPNTSNLPGQMWRRLLSR